MMFPKNAIPVLTAVAAAACLCSCFTTKDETATVNAENLAVKLDAASKALPEAKDDKNFITADPATYAAFQKFMRAVVLTKSVYADESKANYEYLFKAALHGMLSELDPFSGYEDKEIVEEEEKSAGGEMAGVGILVTLSDKSLRVIKVYPNGPAKKAGLQAGDLITEVNGIKLAEKSGSESMNLIPGPAGEQVKLKIVRASQADPIEITITREIINVPSVSGAKIIDRANGIAYISLTAFGKSTANEFALAMEKLEREGMKAMILDLRDNPGGMVYAAVAIASHFLPPNQLVVSLEPRDLKNKQVFNSFPGTKQYPNLPMVIIVNRNSASASELLTACLRDYKKAVVLGETTFGKGVVQTLFPIDKNEMLRITTSRYFSPKHYLIHGNGVKPDITVELSPAYQAKLALQRDLYPGVVNPAVYGAYKDTMLERALEVLVALRVLQKK